MRKYLVLIILMVTFLSCKSTILMKEKEKYEKAFSYIKNIQPYKKEGIHVVDTLIYISQITFFEDLIDNKKLQSNLNILDSLETLDRKYRFQNEHLDLLKNFNNKKMESKYNLYFSKPIKNTLSLKILENKGDEENSYSFLTMFGVGTIYSFEFNDMNEIIDVKKKEVIYN